MPMAREKFVYALTSPPHSILLNLDKLFILHVDASTTDLGAVLSKFVDDKLIHIACDVSRSFKNLEQNTHCINLNFYFLIGQLLTSLTFIYIVDNFRFTLTTIH